jgi:hypothetical protein
MVRLKDTNPSKNFVDNSWIQRYIDHIGRLVEPHSADTFFNNPSGWLHPDEVKMIRSGASFNDILFMRAQKAQQRTVLDRR